MVCSYFASLLACHSLTQSSFFSLASLLRNRPEKAYVRQPVQGVMMPLPPGQNFVDLLSNRTLLTVVSASVGQPMVLIELLGHPHPLLFAGCSAATSSTRHRLSLQNHTPLADLPEENHGIRQVHYHLHIIRSPARPCSFQRSFWLSHPRPTDEVVYSLPW